MTLLRRNGALLLTSFLISGLVNVHAQAFFGAHAPSGKEQWLAGVLWIGTLASIAAVRLSKAWGFGRAPSFVGVGLVVSMLGVAGALWAYIHLGSWEPLAFDLNRSLQLLFIIIIGGLGSIIGSFFGAAFMVLVPVLLTNVPHWLGLDLPVDVASHIEHMVFGFLIVFFLIAEPHGLARLWSIAKEKLRIWPFPH